VASSILTEAAQWLIDRGTPMWQPHDLVPERILGQVDDGSLHLGSVGGEPVATIALMWIDRVFWRDEPEGDSAFVHRLAVRRHVAGTGVAAALLGWAEGRAREEGRAWLRLDCSSNHPGLWRYYEAAGFERHSEGAFGKIRFLRYQKQLR
jgi:GNAT superfamily N-acetyltransferase